MNTERNVEAIKGVVTSPLPKPPALRPESQPKELKARLDWGEPALTIIDVRDRDMFQHERITGAVCMPLDELIEWAEPTLESSRDIYVYGESDEQTTEAVSRLRGAGFMNVAELKGGLQGWKKVSGPIEGIDAKAFR